MLVSSKLKNGTQLYEIHKEGLTKLRTFRNNRLRIIFNVINSSNNDSVQQFNRQFLGQTSQEQQQKQQQANTQQNDQYLSFVYLSAVHKHLSENRTIIFLNAYENPHNPCLLVLGYLVSSVFFYHQGISQLEIKNNGNVTQAKFGENTCLTLMLSALKKLLDDTQVHRLQDQVKYKSGCTKKPYFMILNNTNLNQSQNKNIQKQSLEGLQKQISPISIHEEFRQFYKYKAEKNTLNEAVDTLIDFFPERTALDVDSKQKIQKLGQQYIHKILGRQIFNFQITGTSLENLIFQLCQIFNAPMPLVSATGNKNWQNCSSSIDLQKIFSKIIASQKMQVYDNAIGKHVYLVTQLGKSIPYQMGQFQRLIREIQKNVIQQCMFDASNCMIFGEFLPIYQQLIGHMTKKYQQLRDENREKLYVRSLACYEQIQEQLQIQHHISQMTLDSSHDILESISQKLCLLIVSTAAQSSTGSIISGMVSKLLSQYNDHINELITDLSHSYHQQSQKMIKIQNENRVLVQKCKQLENQAMYLYSINEEFKQKLLGTSNGYDKSNPSTRDIMGAFGEGIQNVVIYEFKKKIMELQMDIADKNQHIKTLVEVLDKLDVQFSRKYFKPKFTKSAQQLLHQLTQKITSIHSLFSELKKTQSFYTEISNQFEQKTSVYLQNLQVEKLQQKQALQKLHQLSIEKQKLQQTITESRTALSDMDEILREYKESVDLLEATCSKLKCQLAQTEGEFEDYRKALQLVSGYYINGRVQKLKDFYKVSSDERLKEILKPILKR